jgi:hypothetical protein
MSYSPPSGSAVGLAFSSASPYVTLGGDVNLEFDSSVVADIRAVGGWMSAAFGDTIISGSQYVRVKGFTTHVVNDRTAIANDSDQFVDMTDGGLAPTSNTSTWIFQVSWQQDIYPEGWNNFAHVAYGLRFRNAGAYTIPDGTNLILNWLGAAYYPPDTTNLVLEFGALGYGYVLGATLYDTSEFGSHSIANVSAGADYLYPTAIAPGSTGSPDVAHSGPRYIYYVGGINSSEFGTTLVSPRYIFPTSWQNDSAVGEPERVRDNKLLPTGIASSNTFGTHYIAWEVQHIYPSGISSAAYGTAVVTFRVRYIEPNGIDSDEYGTLQASLARWLYPSGIDSVEFGDFLSFNGRPIFLDGISDDAYGQPYVYLATQNVGARSIEPGEIGALWVYNFDQHVYHYWDFQIPDTVYGRKNWTFVENVNRELQPSGWNSEKHGYTDVQKTPAIEFVTLGEQTIWGEDTFIDFAIRYRYLDGWDSSQFGRDVDTIIYNNARIVAPTGYDQSHFGYPDPVLNLNRTVKHHTGPTGEEFGADTFIDFAIRYIAPRDIKSSNEGRFEPPSIYYNPRPIAPTGFEGVVAAPYVYIHWNIIYASSVNDGDRIMCGEPFIANFNKTLYPPGRPYDEYGNQARIFNAKQELPLDGWDSNVYGHDTSISYRTKYIVPGKFSVPIIVQTHRIYLDSPGLPVTQTLFPSGQFSGATQGGPPGDYIYGTTSTFGLPYMNSNSVFPEGIGSAFDAPSAVLTTNQLSPEGITAYDGIDVEDYGSESSPLFGICEVIGPRVIYPDPIKSGTVDVTNPPGQNVTSTIGEPRVQPDYIFAPDPIFVVDWWRIKGYGDTSYPWFGHTYVTHRNRSVYPSWPTPNTSQPDGEVMGTPAIDLKHRRVRPKSIFQTYETWHFLLYPHTLYVRLDYPTARGIPPIENFDPESETAVAWVPPYDVEVLPSGCDPEEFYFQTGPMIPSPRIELFNREVLPEGIPHESRYPAGSSNLFTTNLPSNTVIGPWSPGATTFSYSAFGVPLVGPPRRVYPNGFDSFHVGFGDNNNPYPDRDGFVSHKIRTVYPAGWLSQRGQYEELAGGWDTTKIKHALVNSGYKAPRGIESTLAVGVPTIGDGTRTAYPYSVPNTYNVSSALAVKFRVYPVSWDSSEFGDVDKWEEGIVKPYGPDTSEVSPHAQLDRVAAPNGISSDEVGVPRLMVPVYCDGIAELAFFGPYIINEWDCNLRVVAVQIDAGGSEFGTATVTSP